MSNLLNYWTDIAALKYKKKLDINLGSDSSNYFIKNLIKTATAHTYMLILWCRLSTTLSFSFTTDVWHAFALTSHTLLNKIYVLVCKWTPHSFFLRISKSCNIVDNYSSFVLTTKLLNALSLRATYWSGKWFRVSFFKISKIQVI